MARTKSREFSAQVRLQAVLAYESGEGTQAQIAAKVGCAVITFARWLARHRQGLSLHTKPRSGKPSSFAEQERQTLLKIIRASPDLTVGQLRDRINESCHTSHSYDVVWRALRSLKVRRLIKPKPSPDKEVETPEQKKQDKPRYQDRHRSSPPDGDRRAYPSDMTEEQWEILAPLFEKSTRRGRPRKHPLREIVNAVRYIARTSCQWRYLPHDFPPWDLVAKTYYRWIESGTWEKVNDRLREQVRVAEGRNPLPSAGMIDS